MNIAAYLTASFFETGAMAMGIHGNPDQIAKPNHFVSRASG
jgi:hypothetical protein